MLSKTNKDMLSGPEEGILHTVPDMFTFVNYSANI